MRLLSTTLEPAQRRPGPKPRRHQPSVNAPTGQSTTLNEGRGRNPGDTDVLQGLPRYPVFQRSTKAGAETPATLERNPSPLLHAWLAQRRPGPKPRRHAHHGRAVSGGPSRSTKAGAETPATLVVVVVVSVKLSPRSTKAGAETPATPTPATLYVTLNSPAQRRPGPKPRRHRPRRRQHPHRLARSTKAGAETPATRK